MIHPAITKSSSMSKHDRVTMTTNLVSAIIDYDYPEEFRRFEIMCTTFKTEFELRELKFNPPFSFDTKIFLVKCLLFFEVSLLFFRGVKNTKNQIKIEKKNKKSFSQNYIFPTCI